MKYFVCRIAFGIGIILCCIGNISAHTNIDFRVSEALNSSDWFELRRIHNEKEDSIMPMLNAFSEAMIACYFCNPDSACNSIDKLIYSYSQEIGADNVINMTLFKAAQLAKKGDYHNAKNIISDLLSKYDFGASSSYFHELLQQYAALDSIGNINSITKLSSDVIIPFCLDTIQVKGKLNYAIMMEAKVNGTPLKILFDSGAGVNVVREETAQKLGIEKLDLSASAFGIGLVQGKYAVADRIELGNMCIENVPFHLFTITSGVDSIDNKYMSHLDMILGIDFMNLFDELQIDFRKSQIRIPHKVSETEDYEVQNLCGGTRETFIVEAKINGELFNVGIDTGAGGTILENRYYQRFKDYIDTTCESDTLRQAGAGGIKIEKGYKLRKVNIGINGVSSEFQELMVSTEPNEYGKHYATIGMDYFTRFSKIIINIKNRFMRLVE